MDSRIFVTNWGQKVDTNENARTGYVVITTGTTTSTARRCMPHETCQTCKTPQFVEGPRLVARRFPRRLAAGL